MRAGTGDIYIRVAILIPCYNEGVSIAKVVRDFRDALPQATIYVYDNNSHDNTTSQALSAGAIVRHEHQQGKGHVVRRAFRDLDADFYIMVDGDDTYDARIAPDMLALAMTGPFDLVNCVRRETEASAYRNGHRFGNWVLTTAVRRIFGSRMEDILSGYKVFSRRFVKSFPSMASGFDIETEMAVHALETLMPVANIVGDYRGRAPLSQSKLRTYRDGWRILMLIIKLVRHERPILFFGFVACIMLAVALALAEPLLITYLNTGLVPRLPTAVLSMGLTILAVLTALTGVILDTVTRGRRETLVLAYLRYPAPPPALSGTLPPDASTTPIDDLIPSAAHPAP